MNEISAEQAILDELSKHNGQSTVAEILGGILADHEYEFDWDELVKACRRLSSVGVIHLDRCDPEPAGAKIIPFPLNYRHKS